MLLLSRQLLLIFVVLLFSIAQVSASDAEQMSKTSSDEATDCGVVTVNAVAKTSSNDGADVSFHRLLNWSGVIHLVILNDRTDVQPLVLKFRELQEPAYDVYVDGKSVGSRTVGELESGLEVTLPAVILHEDMPLMESITNESSEFIKQLQTQKDPDSQMALAIMANVRLWSQTARSRIRNGGSAYVSLNPTDKALSNPLTWTRPSVEIVRTDTSKYWKALQDQRDIIQTAVNDVNLKTRALSILTPFELTADLKTDGSPVVEYRITNRSDIALTGTLRLENAEKMQVGEAVELAELQRNNSFESVLDLSTSEMTDTEQLTLHLRLKAGKAEFSKSAIVTRATAE